MGESSRRMRRAARTAWLAAGIAAWACGGGQPTGPAAGHAPAEAGSPAAARPLEPQPAGSEVPALPPSPPQAQEPAAEGGDANPGVVEVLVVHQEDRSPVAGVEVQANWVHGERDAGRVRRITGADGRAQLPVRPGAQVQAIYVRPTSATAPAGVRLDRSIGSGERLEQVLEVEPAAVLCGRVLDESGQPAAGAWVRAWFRSRADIEVYRPPDPDVQTQTDEQGRFFLGGFPAGPFVVEAAASGKVAVRRAGGRLEKAQRVEGLLLQIAPGHPVRGEVRGSGGEPVAGAQILAGKEGRKDEVEETQIAGVVYFPSRQLLLRSEDDGSFVLFLVPEDETWELAVADSRHLIWNGRLEAGQSLVQVRLEAGFAVAGRVVDPEGKPLRKVDMRLRGPQDARLGTDKDGRFSIPALKEESGWFLLLHKSGYGARVVGPLVAAKGGEPVEIVLHPGAKLSGVVVDAKGRPVGGARVEIQRVPPATAGSGDSDGARLVKPPEQVFRLNSTVTTADGRFEFVDLERVRFRIRASAGQGDSAAELEAEAGAGDLRVELRGGGS